MGFHMVHSQKPSSVSVVERRKKELRVGGERGEGEKDVGGEGGKGREGEGRGGEGKRREGEGEEGGEKDGGGEGERGEGEAYKYQLQCPFRVSSHSLTDIPLSVSWHPPHY